MSGPVQRLAESLRTAAGALIDLATEYPDVQFSRNAVGNLAIWADGEQIGYVDWWHGLTIFPDVHRDPNRREPR